MEAVQVGNPSCPTVPNLPDLPPEIWTEIFTHISPCQLLKMRQVCRRWRDIATSRSVLRAKLSVTFSKTCPIDVDYLPYPALFPVGRINFEYVNIAGVCSWWPSIGPGLVKFQISDCSIKFPVLVGFLKNTPNIKVLHLARILCIGEWNEHADIKLCNLEDLWLEDFVEGLDIFRDCNLKILGFTWESINVSSLEFANFVSRFQNTLEELYITATDDVLIELMKLDRLMLKKLMLYSFEFENSQLIVEFCRKQPFLEHLDLSQILSFDGIEEDAELKEIGELLARLTFLSLNINPDTLLDLSFLSKMPKLKNLQIDGISNDFPADVAGPLCPDLREVTFSCVHFVGFSVINVLVSMPYLRILNFEHCDVDCWSDLLEALESLKLLRKLTLWITNAKEPTYSDFDDLANLKHLKIFLCEMPPGLLATILTRCPNLKELDLPVMDHPLEDETVRVIGQKLPLLNQLTVQRIGFSEANERFIRENCGSLQVFEITK